MIRGYRANEMRPISKEKHQLYLNEERGRLDLIVEMFRTIEVKIKIYLQDLSRGNNSFRVEEGFT